MTILKLSIFNSIARMLQMSVYFFLGIHFSAIGLSGGQIGIIFALHTISTLITIIPSGVSSDTFKAKYLVTLGLILSSIQYFGIAYTREFMVLAILLICGGIGKSIYTASINSLFYKSASEKAPKEIGIFHGIGSLMIGAGMIFTGFMLQTNISFEKLFLIVGISYLIMTLIGQIILPGTRTTKFNLMEYKKDILRPKVLILIFTLLIFAIHFGAEHTCYGLFLKNSLKLNNLEIGLYMGIAVCSMGIASFIISKIFHKLKPERLLLGGILLSSIGHILMSITTVKISLIFRIIHEFGDAAMFFFLSYGIIKLFEKERIGGNAGIFNFTSTIGSAIGALIFGPIGEIYGYDMALLYSGIITLIAFFLALQFLHLLKHD